ncbi:MAG TPA: hypothetical protein PKA15_03530, partial [Chitinophagales bacterium]|nr:hypothetical protein [Chitinophagales bacterium]
MTIKTQIPNNNYRENWDNIFNKEDKKKCKNQICLCSGACKKNVMPLDDMLPMVGSSGGKFAMKFNPEHQQHGWIFYDNHGQWVTLRRALPHEVELAKAIIEMRKNLPN